MNGKLIISDGQREKVYEICDERVVVGSGEAADLRIRCDTISAAHCEIRSTPRGFRLVDCETASGTTVNGSQVNQHMLKNGDTVRIGSIKLTYVGDSAQAPAKPRHAARSVPPALPKKENGEPRRFYRHETTAVRKRSNPTMVLVVVGIIAVVGFLILQLSKSSFQSTAKKQWYDMKDLLKADTLADAKKAKKILDSIPASELDAKDREQMRQDILAKIGFHEQAAKAREVKKRYGDIVRGYRSGANDVAWLRNQVERFGNDFPGTQSHVDLKALLKKATYGTPANELKWNEAREEIRKAVRTSQYKLAFASLSRLERDEAIVGAYGEHLSILKKTTKTAFERFGEEALRQAAEARKQGDDKRARELYQILADIGQEPFVSQAREKLAGLD